MSFFNGACQPTDDHINEISEHTIGDTDGELPDLLDATGAGHHNEVRILSSDWLAVTNRKFTLGENFLWAEIWVQEKYRI